MNYIEYNCLGYRVYLSDSLSEHFALQNVACKQAIWLIFPIQWSELSTSLKATLRVSDLSFGSLSELSTSLKATLRVSDLSFRFIIKY